MHRNKTLLDRCKTPLSSVWSCMWESSVESKIISFAQNFFKNSLNQIVIRDLIIIMACVCS